MNPPIDNSDLVPTASGLLIRPPHLMNISTVGAATGIRGKLYHVLQTGFLADVTFLVGANEIPIQAHKIILAFSSPVFEAMFYGPIRDEGSTVAMPDVEPEAFSLMLEYIYTRDVPVRIPIQTCIQTLYAARKYTLPDMEKSLLRQLTDLVTVDTAATLLSTATLFELALVESKCWDCIDLDTERFFASDDFRNLDETLVKKVISRDNLAASELSVYKAVVGWGKGECLSRGIPVDSTNIRTVLENVLPLVRFPLMEPVEFANGPAQSGILSPEEISNVMVTKFATGVDKPLSIFSPKKRTSKSDAVVNVRCICQNRVCMFCNPFAHLKPNDTDLQLEKDQNHCVFGIRKRNINGVNSIPLYCSCRTRGYCPDKRIQ